MSDSEVDLQIEALLEVGCRRKDIFVDKVSGARKERPGLYRCLNELGQGDMLIVWRLDRLGRSMPHLVSILEDLMSRGVGFKSICDGAIDTTTASGQLMFNIFSSLAQFERHLIQERTKAGLAAARARGRVAGRKPLSKFAPKVLAAQKMYQGTKVPISEICEKLEISRATLYRYLQIK